MKILLVSLLSWCMINGCSPYVELKGRSKSGLVWMEPLDKVEKQLSKLPAHLVLVDKYFEEPDGDQALDAEEVGYLVVTLRNDGLGPAKISALLTPLSNMEHLFFKRRIALGVLPIQEEKSYKIALEAGIKVEDALREMRVELVEEYARSTIPFTFSFYTHRLAVPEFRVVIRNYDDGNFFKGNTPDGLVETGEMIKVVANVQNVGGEAEGVEVKVELERKSGLQYTRDLKGSSDNRFLLGQMGPGTDQDIGFFFFTSPVFADSIVKINVRVTESRRQFGATEAVAFNIGQSLRTEDVLAVEVSKRGPEDYALVRSDRIDIEQVPQNSKTRLDKGLAVIFGIEDYKYTFNAAYKNRDAAVFFRYFRDVLRIPEERISLKVNHDATKAEFDYVFEPKGSPNQGWIKKRLSNPQEAGQTDLFVYLGGHGFPDISSGQPYLIPYDVRPVQATNGISLERLYQTLSEFGFRSVTVFVESCFSGASGYDPSGGEKLLALNMNPVFPVMEQPMIGPQTVVFTATSGKMPSNNRDDLKHGIFSYFVLKGLGGMADGNGDKAVTVEELFAYVRREVPPKALEAPLDREQVPELLPSLNRLKDRGKRVLVQY